MDRDSNFTVSAPVWRWRPTRPEGGGWYFLTVDGQTAVEIRYAALGRTGGFGSIRVDAQIGRTRWQTSLFPLREAGGLILPLKAEVRRREGIDEGTIVTALLSLP